MLVDLTLPISEDLPGFPGSPAPGFLSWSDLKEDGYNLELLFMSSHSGTHIDAPYHFVRNGQTVDEVPVERLMRTAILIKAPKAANGEISKSDIISFEQKNRVIPDQSTVIFHTGWQKNLSRKNYFTQNPGLSKAAARYLASKHTNLVGIDSPSIDPGRDHGFGAHHLLLKNDILIVENLSNLEKIRQVEFSFTALPLRLNGASGSPVRAVGAY